MPGLEHRVVCPLSFVITKKDIMAMQSIDCPFDFPGGIPPEA